MLPQIQALVSLPGETAALQPVAASRKVQLLTSSTPVEMETAGESAGAGGVLAEWQNATSCVKSACILAQQESCCAGGASQDDSHDEGRREEGGALVQGKTLTQRLCSAGSGGCG